MNNDRREFLKKAGCALTFTALASQMRHFGLMDALAQAAPAVPSDYRALVCVFLAGGNDGNNMIIPNHSDGSISNYTVYSNARNAQGLAIAQNTLLPITVPRMGNLTYGLHPSLGPQTPATNIVNNGIHELWGQGKLCAVTNVGTLVAPMTKTQYQNGSVQKPFQLFSHSDQIAQYQAGRSDISSFTGWGGRISDARNATDNPSGLIPMITSIAGAQLFTAGQVTLPMAIADSGTSLSSVLQPVGFCSPTPCTPTGSAGARFTAFNNLRQFDTSNNYIAAASHVTDLAMQANSALQTSQDVTTTFPNTSIGRQLKQVARLIKSRGSLSVNRQIFFVSLGGFDTHNVQVTTQQSLLIQLAQAMRSFYDEMVAQSISDKVTQFTMADFSRTFSPAGTGSSVGSDHAWANHHLVLGGGITAADFFGINTTNGTPFPSLTFNGPDDADSGSSARGRWIPTTSVEQYAATLSRWYGLPDASLGQVFPKISNFSNTNLGFMQPA